jgi:hypothetical protein
MKLVYVAGPFRAATPWRVECNIRRAEAMALELCKIGVVGICPHTMWRHFSGELHDSFWLSAGLRLLERCDAVAVFGRWQESTGTIEEMRRAEELGIPVFFGAAAVSEWIRS